MFWATAVVGRLLDLAWNGRLGLRALIALTWGLALALLVASNDVIVGGVGAMLAYLALGQHPLFDTAPIRETLLETVYEAPVSEK